MDEARADRERGYLVVLSKENSHDGDILIVAADVNASPAVAQSASARSSLRQEPSEERPRAHPPTAAAGSRLRDPWKVR